jgi:hypothetical protein
MTTKSKQLFALGDIVATKPFMTKVDPRYALSCLELHHAGNWGLCDAHDNGVNDNALKTGGRVMSVWPLPDEAETFWIITEADRSVTTFLLPSDY